MLPFRYLPVAIFQIPVAAGNNNSLRASNLHTENSKLSYVLATTRVADDMNKLVCIQGHPGVVIGLRKYKRDRGFFSPMAE